MTPQSQQPSVVWFRQDLRLSDNPALAAAADLGAPILPLFVLDERAPGPWATGGAARWWLDRSLAALEADLRALGLPLVLRRGPAQEVVPQVAAEVAAGAVFWNRCYEPFAIARDSGFVLLLSERIGENVTRHAEVTTLDIDPVLFDSAFELKVPADARRIYRTERRGDTAANGRATTR